MNTRRLVSVALLSAYGSIGLSGLAAAHEPEKLGNVNFPISCSAEAQPAFNRAVAMLHNFWFPQALNAFAEVALTAKADSEKTEIQQAKAFLAAR